MITELNLPAQHTVDVFGVCVSTSWYSIPTLHERIKRENIVSLGTVCEKQSIFSAITPPFPFDIDLIKVPHDEEDPKTLKRVINQTFNKPFFQSLGTTIKASEYLIVDLCAEKAPVFQIEGTLIDDNWGHLIAEALTPQNPLKTERDEYVRDDIEKCKEMVKVFCLRLLENYSPEKIIIHKVFYQNKVRVNGKILSVNKTLAAYHDKSNAIMQWFYKQVEIYLPDSPVFQMPEDTYIDLNYHFRPGVVQGVHFELKYFEDFYEWFCKKIQYDEDVAASRGNAELSPLNQRFHAYMARTQLLKDSIRSRDSTIASLESTLRQREAELQNALEKVSRYHRMSKDPGITLYRKLRRTMGMWHY